MEIIVILLAVILILAFLKFLGLIFHAGVWIIALPFKIIGLLIASVVMIAVFIPLGVLGAIASIVMIPVVIIIPLAPFIIIALGIWLLVKRNE